ncbi:phosphatidylinositol-4-phosphate 5-kinase [Cyanidiococcus yangmingshanensis]|uniref:Phosphatidylinositol-4-phosphate 5-kinase n=1 Tax=Cyanidiococcus yangmingshanensis TaxID=2690220 RepID=A0A7J7IPY7_9RHOD|nr:phosphatidylinositol-4-phosphate 5-kinase [Cyanidiococcus yangmingshanensis]
MSMPQRIRWAHYSRNIWRSFRFATRQRHHIRFVVVPDLFPSAFRLHEKYDLKGSRRSKPRTGSWRPLHRKWNERLQRQSLHRRQKSGSDMDDLDQNDTERAPVHLRVPRVTLTEHEWCERIAFSQLVAVPILKEDDLHSPFLIQANTYTILMRMLERDTALLESLLVMDYSLLIGLSEPIPATASNWTSSAHPPQPSPRVEACLVDETPMQSLSAGPDATTPNPNEFELVASSAWTSPLAHGLPPAQTKQSLSPTGTQRIVVASEDMHLFRDLLAFRRESGSYVGYKLRLGIIDALQHYSVPKRLEFGWKLFIYCGAVPSVCPPTFYRKRFLEYMRNVFVPYNEVDLPRMTVAHHESLNGVSEVQG